MTWFAIRAFRAAAAEQGKTELLRMTPARFDILFLIETRYYGPRPPGITGIHPQMHLSEITDRLGLSASTISKTVSGMVKHGYVKRFEDHVDGRRVLVALTDDGEKAYLSALSMLQTDRILREKLEVILTTLRQAGHPPRLTVEEHRANGIDIHHRQLRAVAREHEYWADDLYEPYFDGSVDSPLQHIYDDRRARRALRRRKIKPRREIQLWEYWRLPRPLRQSSSAAKTD